MCTKLIVLEVNTDKCEIYIPQSHSDKHSVKQNIHNPSTLISVSPEETSFSPPKCSQNQLPNPAFFLSSMSKFLPLTFLAIMKLHLAIRQMCIHLT